MAKCSECEHEMPEIDIRADGLCYGCHLDTYIPRDYQALERYVWDEVWGHDNATHRPQMGVAFLDQHNDIWELIAACVRKPRI